VITTPIACVLGVFSNLFIGRDTEGYITSTLPDDWQYDLSWLYYWNPDNPQEIDRNSSVIISVIGGFPPYTWSVSGNGFILSLDETEGLSNALIADDSACGTATITVTDNYGVPVTGYIRCTAGQWITTGDHVCTPPCEATEGGGGRPWCGNWRISCISGNLRYCYVFCPSPCQNHCPPKICDECGHNYYYMQEWSCP